MLENDLLAKIGCVAVPSKILSQQDSPKITCLTVSPDLLALFCLLALLTIPALLALFVLLVLFASLEFIALLE